MIKRTTNFAPLTRLAAEFVVANRKAELPRTAVDVARVGITDAVAVQLAGKNELIAKIMVGVVTEQGGKPEAPYLFGQGSATMEQSAMIGATVAHALDFDDFAFACHPSAVLMPLILACGYHYGSSGSDLVAAYVAGYEIWADLMLREADHLHSYGWHPTPIFGVIGAAAAAASLMNLNVDQTQNALGLAASHAAGNMGNFGSMAKPYHGGKAAAEGILSARMAAHGMTATPDVIESAEGLLQSLSPEGNVDVTTVPEHLAYKRILANRINIKKYPTVGASQRIIDSLMAYLAENTPDLSQIEKLEPLVSEKYAHIMFIHQPTTREEAKFSLEFAVACSLVHGKVGLHELEDKAVQLDQVQEMIRKVEIVTTDVYDPDYPVVAPEDYVTITFKDGSRVVTPPIKRFTGHADIPLSSDQLQEKFLKCAEYGGLSREVAGELFARFQSVETWSPQELQGLKI